MPVTKAASRSRRASAKPQRAPATFGRTGTAGKAEGHDAVRAWIAGINPAHRPIARRLDALIGELVPDVRRAVKWSAPFYGRTGQGWIASIGSFKHYLSLGFFAGATLDPPPPEGDKGQMRRVLIHDPSEFDEHQFRSWIRQAASLKGWGTVS